MSTTTREQIGPNWYLITRDDAGNVIAQVGNDPPPVMPAILSKLEYRNLFTLQERVAIDSMTPLPPAPALTVVQQATLNSIHFDFQLADTIVLSNPSLIAATQLLETYGLIGPGRAAQVLANQPAPPSAPPPA